MKKIVCAFILMLVVLLQPTALAAYSSGSQGYSAGSYGAQTQQGHMFNLSDYDAMTSTARMFSNQGSLSVGYGICCSFELWEPIEDCEYLSIPVRIHGLDNGFNYGQLRWVSVFRNAKTGIWFTGNQFTFRDGAYQNAVLDLKGRDAVTVDAFSVVPDRADYYGAFEINYKYTAQIGIKSDQWATYFSEQLSAILRYRTPSAADLDAIYSQIHYPRKDSFYLNYYISTYVTRPSCYAFIDPNSSNVMAESNRFDVTKGERVAILAESSGYACVIFPDLGRAGWINCEYLANS